MKTVTDFRILLSALAMVVVTAPALADDGIKEPEPTAKFAPKQIDRLDLDATSVTGNSELPKVLYIVPWKESGSGNLSGKPVNSLLDDVLAPIDRDVFRRQISYYDQLQAADTSSEVAVNE